MLCTSGDNEWFKFGKPENSVIFNFVRERKGYDHLLFSTLKINEYVVLRSDINSPKNDARTKSKGAVNFTYFFNENNCLVGHNQIWRVLTNLLGPFVVRHKYIWSTCVFGSSVAPL